MVAAFSQPSFSSMATTIKHIHVRQRWPCSLCQVGSLGFVAVQTLLVSLVLQTVALSADSFIATVTLGTAAYQWTRQDLVSETSCIYMKKWSEKGERACCIVTYYLYISDVWLINMKEIIQMPSRTSLGGPSRNQETFIVMTLDIQRSSVMKTSYKLWQSSSLLSVPQ